MTSRAGRRDIRDTDIYREIEAHFKRAIEPALGKVSGAADPELSPDGTTIAFTGSVWERFEGRPVSRVCLAARGADGVERITAGPHSDRLPRWSPDGSQLAFLSDRAKEGRFQLFLLPSRRLGEAIACPEVDGSVEYLQWSPSGAHILLGIAGLGADLAGGQGSGTTAGREEDLPGWVPKVEGEPTADDWRWLAVYDLASNTVRRVSRDGLNVWEASWAGDSSVVAVVSEAPGEGSWYTAPLAFIDVATSAEQVLYRSAVQLGVPVASRSGSTIAVIEAVCSDRQVVAGDVLLLDPTGREVRRVDTEGVDVTHLAFTPEQQLFYTGQRGLETVFGFIDLASATSAESWATHESCGGRYPFGSPGPGQSFAIVHESYSRHPELALVRNGTPETFASLRHPGADYIGSVAGALEEVSWMAPDGLEIQGLLIRPNDAPVPGPLVLMVHGGPIWAFRNRWQGGYPSIPLLVSRGYAVLLPNPRGSAGRGQEFAGMVVGDMGGADTHDYLAGVDAMVERGFADPARLGVTGGSYGGFMSAWLITQTDRFAAAMPQAPVTDWGSSHLTSNIPEFDRMFLAADPYEAGGNFHVRSPVTFAANAVTPTLQTTGELDECTPPTQALEFHRALLEHGVESVVVTYPGEGHGVRRLPALVDQHARMIDWFDSHMPARAAVSLDGRAAPPLTVRAERSDPDLVMRH